ncbi:MAG: flagellar assembly protein FliX [Geminicoccaceae bacterium]
MRIAPNSGPGRAERRQAVNRGTAAGQSAFSTGTANSSASTSPSVELAGSAPLASLGAIIAAQGAEELEERRERARQHGEDTLDVLSELRDAALAEGSAAYNHDRLRRIVESNREPSGDERLDSVLDEIDLRAAVELAKIDREV